ncbi:MAG: alpha-1,4-glucan--maltose-1-phosphate maltosyltransferase [Solirubrobacterales bacterium]|nr:alpha-1,4-glucan--maltose-1-phosphate maltosyltransferase [Solirubrobacterales bacterium]
MPAPDRTQATPRILVERLKPCVDCGRYPAKASVGDDVPVSADVFRDGHEVLRAVVRYRAPGQRGWHEAPLAPYDAHVGGNGFAGSFPVDRQGTWTFSFEAWADAFASWHSEVTRKRDAGEPDLGSELLEGRALVEATAARAKGADRDRLDAALAAWSLDEALAVGVSEAAARWPDRSAGTRTAKLEIDVDRVRARYGAWYELFPRSWGGLKGTADVVPQLAELGFDVLYLPPVHPIGVKNRKGRNNSVTAGPDDPGSPWAIGSLEGGHKAIHPELGTEEDFAVLVEACREHEIDIALDFAIQCSADHPWLTEHPEWFSARPDGTLKYAENPPKKYQDIYNVNWDTDDWQALWQELLDTVLYWVSLGVKVFRVDNPHTKPFAFWEWLIKEVREREPDVIFLAEAFTKAAVMRALAKIGFSQSYTYFTWKNHREELIEYLVELTQSGMQDYYRPNFFANTPDILSEHLQHGGSPAFHSRLVLAATLSPTYGIYSGFERFENVAVKPGSEEYLDSEKYEAKKRRLDGPLLPTIKKVNALRRAHPALQQLTDLRFLGTGNDQLIAYVKRSGSDTVLTVVNMDPYHAQEGSVDVVGASGLPGRCEVRDGLTGEHFHWGLGHNFVRLNPGGAHILEVL